jgi:hypothetical protein
MWKTSDFFLAIGIVDARQCDTQKNGRWLTILGLKNHEHRGESYLARFSEPQNFEREVSTEENKLSTFVAAECDNREIVSLRELAEVSLDF